MFFKNKYTQEICTHNTHTPLSTTLMECKVYMVHSEYKINERTLFQYKKKHTKDNFVRTILFFLINRIFSLTKDKLLNLLNVCVNEYIYIYI